MNKKMLLNISWASAAIATIIALFTIWNLTPDTSSSVAALAQVKGYSAASFVGLLSLGSFFVGIVYPKD